MKRKRLFDAGEPLVEVNAFEHQPRKCQSDASLDLRRLSEVYWERKIMTTLDYMLYKVRAHQCLVPHCAPSPNPRVWHVAAAN